MLFPNATVTLTRGQGSKRTQVYIGRRVELTFASRDEVIRAEGGRVPVFMADLPDSDYRQGDIVTLTAQDGHTLPPQVANYAVGAVERLSGVLAYTRVQLTGQAGTGN